MKLIKTAVTYTDKNGKERKGTNFYIVLDSGATIAIKPAFNNDYRVLTIIADSVN